MSIEIKKLFKNRECICLYIEVTVSKYDYLGGIISTVERLTKTKYRMPLVLAFVFGEVVSVMVTNVYTVVSFSSCSQTNPYPAFRSAVL